MKGSPGTLTGGIKWPVVECGLADFDLYPNGWLDRYLDQWLLSLALRMVMR